MTIVVHAAGNGKIGVGHLSRTRSLVAAFIEAEQKVAVIYEGDEQLIRHYQLAGASYHRVDNHSEAIRLRKMIIEDSSGLQPILVTDLLSLDKAAEQLAREQGFRSLIHLNDSGIPSYCPDIWVNGDAFASADTRLDKKVIQLVGAAYHIVQPVVSQRRSRPWNKPSVQRVLISMGGSDPDGITEQLAAIAQTFDWCEFTIVIGPAFNEIRKKQLVALSSPHLNVVTDVFDLSALMVTHDLVITLGGISSYEAMCLGVPVAAIAWKYLMPYVSGLDKMGLLNSLGEIEQAKPKLAALLRGSTAILAARATKAFDLIDGQGASRVVAAVLSARGE